MQFSRTFKNIVQSIAKDDCLGMASGMAFNFMMAIFPFLMISTALFGMLGTEKTVNDIILSIKSIAPPEALYVMESTLKQTLGTASTKVLIFGIVIGIVFASNAINVLMRFLNRVYGVPETRPAWKKRLITLWVIILFFVALVAVTNLIILGKIIILVLDEFTGMHEPLLNTLNFIRWPITFLLLLIIGFIIYYFMPNVSGRFKSKVLSSLPGTLFFTVGWLGVSRLFGLYVENIAHYNSVYGTLGAVIILLLWMYYTALVILVGGEVNCEFYKYFKARE